MARLDAIAASQGADFGQGAGDQKEEHLARMRESGQFRLTREISIHSEERGDAERFIGLMLSNSGSILMEHGIVTGEQLHLEDFRARAQAILGDSTAPLVFQLSGALRRQVTALCQKRVLC